MSTVDVHSLLADSALVMHNLSAFATARQDRAALTGRLGLQVQLDGSVSRSGVGIPPWDRWLDDIPTLDSIQTRLTDGIGSSK